MRIVWTEEEMTAIRERAETAKDALGDVSKHDYPQEVDDLIEYILDAGDQLE